MRKWIWFFLFSLLSIILFYILFPGKTSIHAKEQLSINEKVFAKGILNNESWRKLLGNNWNVANNALPQFKFQANSFKIIEQKQSSVDIIIKKWNDSIATELFYFPINPDKNIIQIDWTASLPFTLNPLKRVKNYLLAKEVKLQMQVIIDKLKDFYSSSQNIYGFEIKRAHVLDSNLISTSITTKSYPATSLVYDLIEDLKNYASTQHATITNFPMLHILKKEDSTYITKVAIPVNSRLANSGKIEYKWMLGGGNILTTQITGGPYKIQEGFKALEAYVSDNNLVAPAIEFESLITDRLKVQDTAKWITQLYYPVM